MIRIYTSPSCASCRKAVAFLKEHKIPFKEKNILTALLSEAEIRDILVKSENGTDDIISKRSKIIKEGNVDIDSMKVSELIAFIRENPTVLKRPIIVNDRLMQVGYNKEEIRTFIPRELRRLMYESNCGPDCPNCKDDCYKK